MALRLAASQSSSVKSKPSRRSPSRMSSSIAASKASSRSRGPPTSKMTARITGVPGSPGGRVSKGEVEVLEHVEAYEIADDPFKPSREGNRKRHVAGQSRSKSEAQLRRMPRQLAPPPAPVNDAAPVTSRIEHRCPARMMRVQRAAIGARVDEGTATWSRIPVTRRLQHEGDRGINVVAESKSEVQRHHRMRILP